MAPLLSPALAPPQCRATSPGRPKARRSGKAMGTPCPNAQPVVLFPRGHHVRVRERARLHRPGVPKRAQLPPKYRRKNVIVSFTADTSLGTCRCVAEGHQWAEGLSAVLEAMSNIYTSSCSPKKKCRTCTCRRFSTVRRARPGGPFCASALCSLP